MGPKRRRTKSPYFDNIESEVPDSQSNVPSELPTTTRRTRGRSKTVRTTKQDVQDIISSSVLVEDEVLKADEDDSNEPTTSKRKTRSRVAKGKKRNAVESSSDATFLDKQNGVKLDFEDIADEPSTSKGKKRKKEVKSKNNIGNDQKPESVCDIGNYHKDSLNAPSTSKGVSRSRRSVNRNLSKNSSSIVNGNKSESDENSQDFNHSEEKNNIVNSDSDEDSDADDWEEVEEAKIADDEDALENYKPQLPEQGVQITIDGPKIFNKKRRKKKVDVDELLRQQLNRMKKELQVEMHKTHLLCLLSRGFYLNRLTYHPLISSLALSHLTSFTFDLKKINLLFVRDFTNWFRSWFTLEKKPRSKTDLLGSLTQAFETSVVHSQVAYVLMFLAFLRIYSPKIQLRLCYALNPISIKPDNLIMTEKQRSKAKSSKDDPEEPSKSKSSNKTADKKLPSEKLNAEKNDKKMKEATNINPSRGKKRKKSSDEEDEDYEMDSDDEKRSKAKGKRKGKRKPRAKVSKVENKSIISEDDSNDLVVVKTTEDKNLLEYWCEIYVETEEKWVCLDVEAGIWDDPSKIEKRSHNPLLYVVSWDNFSHVKDVSQRYCSDFASCKFRRSRIDEDWWNETLSFFRPHKRTRQEKREDKELAEIFADRPMPTTLSDFKNHPLYVLKKHLLKYEVIYPPDSPTLGNFRGEPVYARECVKDVHSKEYWMRQARVVRSNEEPYKMSLKRKKWDRNLGDFLRDLPLELFGEWQTDPYIPPEAKDGKVPRNQYGNVELFQPCMLPKRTVYLQLPGLIRIANKLKIDCAPAVVGFDNCSGGAGVHPVFEGFVVCEEFADTLKAAWEEEQMNIRKRELEKREKRIYGNWKKLIIGVLIKEQVKLKYNRDQSEDTETTKSSAVTLDDIDTILSMYAKKRKKGPSKAKKPKSSISTKKSNKRKSRKGEDTSDEEDEDEDDDIDDFIVEDDEDLEEDEEKIKNDEEEEAETELEISDSD